MSPADQVRPARPPPRRRFVTAVDPDHVPDLWLRQRLRGSPPDTSDPGGGLAEVLPWAGAVAAALLSVAAVVVVVVLVTYPAIAVGLFALAAAIMAGLPVWYWVGRWRELATARRVDRLLASRYVVTEGEQRAVAERVPELGERMVNAGELTDRLRRPQEAGGLAGTLPGVDDDALDRIHHRIVAELARAAELAEALDEAGERPALAALVAARTGELAAACEAVDLALAQLTRLVAAAGEIADQQDEAALAERLTVAPSPAAAVVLPQPASDDLPDLLVAAEAALELHGISHHHEPGR